MPPVLARPLTSGGVSDAAVGAAWGSRPSWRAEASRLCGLSACTMRSRYVSRCRTRVGIRACKGHGKGKVLTNNQQDDVHCRHKQERCPDWLHPHCHFDARRGQDDLLLHLSSTPCTPFALARQHCTDVYSYRHCKARRNQLCKSSALI